MESETKQTVAGGVLYAAFLAIYVVLMVMCDRTIKLLMPDAYESVKLISMLLPIFIIYGGYKIVNSAAKDMR